LGGADTPRWCSGALGINPVSCCSRASSLCPCSDVFFFLCALCRVRLGKRLAQWNAPHRVVGGRNAHPIHRAHPPGLLCVLCRLAFNQVIRPELLKRHVSCARFFPTLAIQRHAPEQHHYGIAPVVRMFGTAQLCVCSGQQPEQNRVLLRPPRLPTNADPSRPLRSPAWMASTHTVANLATRRTRRRSSTAGHRQAYAVGHQTRHHLRCRRLDRFRDLRTGGGRCVGRRKAFTQSSCAASPR